MASRRQTILELFKSRLETIDADTPVLLGETPAFGNDDPNTALVILPGDDAVQQQGQAIFLVLPIEIHLLAKVDLEEPWVAIEELLAAVKTAIEVNDDLLRSNAKDGFQRGPTRTLPRESGSTSIGAILTYFYTYSETWSQP